ncbi:MAG: SRPBCC domain-containing protein [Candidatus Magasanikbacteria bacterium]|nr:SRPBCC domain-containing protein [Candidatus Magasanikbacteria bacterium]
MEKLHHEIFIAAPVEKVWNTMLEKETYMKWTKPFSPGTKTESWFEGSWDKGSDLKFIGVDDDGNKGGMASRVAENRKHEFISIEHIGIVDAEGNVDTTSEFATQWTPAFENYTFVAKDGGTQVQVDVDTVAEYKEMFDTAWPKALALLKEMAEK